MQWLNRLICKAAGHRTSGKNKLTGTSGMLISGHMQPPDEHQAYVFSTCRRCGVPFAVGVLDRPDEWRPRGNLGSKHVRLSVLDESELMEAWYPDKDAWFETPLGTGLPDSLADYDRVAILLDRERQAQARQQNETFFAGYLRSAQWSYLAKQIVAFKFVR